MCWATSITMTRLSMPPVPRPDRRWLPRTGVPIRTRTTGSRCVASCTSCARAIEHLNEPFKGIFDVHGQVPTKGLVNTRRFALGAVFVYQLTLWYRQEQGLDLRVGLKPFLKAA
jgi:hypothetical protein